MKLSASGYTAMAWWRKRAFLPGAIDVELKLANRASEATQPSMEGRRAVVVSDAMVVVVVVI